jgi:hypothetical protein
MNALGINMDFTVYAIAFAILVSILTMRFVLREQNTVQQISGPPSPSWLFGGIHALPTTRVRLTTVPQDTCCN